MLVGHLAAGLVAKRIEPKISLGTWILAALLSDLIVFPLLIAGVEHFDTVPGATLNRTVGRDIVYSHGLLSNVIWAALFATIYFLRRRYPCGALLTSSAIGRICRSRWERTRSLAWAYGTRCRPRCSLKEDSGSWRLSSMLARHVRQSAPAATHSGSALHCLRLSGAQTLAPAWTRIPSRLGSAD